MDQSFYFKEIKLSENNIKLILDNSYLENFISESTNGKIKYLITCDKEITFNYVDIDFPKDIKSITFNQIAVSSYKILDNMQFDLTFLLNFNCLLDNNKSYIFGIDGDDVKCKINNYYQKLIYNSNNLIDYLKSVKKSVC